MAPPKRYVRSAHVVAYWQDGHFVLKNFAAGTMLAGAVDYCAILDACETSQSLTDIQAKRPDLDIVHLRAAVQHLVASRMLHEASHKRPRAELAMAKLGAWAPEAGFFHQATKTVAFDGYGDGDATPDDRSESGRPAPPVVKRHPGGRAYPLPLPEASGEFVSTLLARRTHRRFSRAPLTLASLAQLLRFTAGMHSSLNTQHGSQVRLRTSPSGGGRHPIDVYLAISRVKGVPPGWYHYASDRHALEQLRSGLRRAHMSRYVTTQSWFSGAAVLVFFVARFEKTLWRYPYSRAYRAVLLEAGHLCQTFCLTATWLGLAPFCSIAIDDAAIERDLGLDGILESVVYAAGVGARTGSGDSGTTPEHIPPLSVRRNRAFVNGTKDRHTRRKGRLR